jgi:uncharacterized protein (TIGR04141 family)
MQPLQFGSVGANKPPITVTFTPKKKRVRPAFEIPEYRRLWRTMYKRIKDAKDTPANPPSWQRFVQQGTATPLGPLLNQSASGLILLTAAGRFFAIAFGYGRHWIDEAQIVRRFGMIVTLNVVHPDRIRSVDREEFDTIQRKTRSQTSISSNIDSFGLNIGQRCYYAATIRI